MRVTVGLQRSTAKRQIGTGTASVTVAPTRGRRYKAMMPQTGWHHLLLFPRPPRAFPGQRWVRIAVRTGHLASMGLLLGGVAAGHAPAELSAAMWGTLLSGAVFVALELYQSGVWLLQLKGWAVMLKLMLFIGAVTTQEHSLPLLYAALVVGGISSHMPGRYRYYSPLHGRVVKQ